MAPSEKGGVTYSAALYRVDNKSSAPSDNKCLFHDMDQLCLKIIDVLSKKKKDYRCMYFHYYQLLHETIGNNCVRSLRNMPNSIEYVHIIHFFFLISHNTFDTAFDDLEVFILNIFTLDVMISQHLSSLITYSIPFVGLTPTGTLCLQVFSYNFTL